jgi:redox-sensing transcriptional repressor
MHMKDDLKLSVPLPTIRRYPIYLRAIHAMIAGGELHISSAVLADKLSLDPVLTRKDLAMAGVPGKPRRGYPAKELADAISRALGWDSATDAVLVGVGSLGKALLCHSGFEEQNLSIAGAFDAEPSLTGRTFHGVKVRAMDDLPRLVRRLKIRLAILTVPNAAAQTCTDALVAVGIRGILNFTAIQLAVPEGVVVQNVDIAQSLAVLSHTIANRQTSKRTS